MRDVNWSMYGDVKHISKMAVPKFASNLKRALRKAYGKDETFSNHRRGSQNYSNFRVRRNNPQQIYGSNQNGYSAPNSNDVLRKISDLLHQVVR